MKIKFIVKPIASKKKAKEFEKELFNFKTQFQNKDEIEEVFTTAIGENNARILAKRAIEDGFEKIIFVGGDGLLNEGLNGIMEATGGTFSPNFAVGIIPTGSGNNFSKELKIPQDIKGAFDVIRNNRKFFVDIGKANERFFINCISFDFDGLVNKIANEVKEKYPFLPKQGSYLLAAFKEMILKIPNFEIKIEGDIKCQEKIISLAITNSQSYGGIFKINPGAKVDDGKFNLCLIEPVGKIRAFIDILKVIKGTHLQLLEVKTFLISNLEISSTNPLPFEMDGEVPEPKKEYKISIFPRTLPILIP